ncbi:unnamed protein product [Calypogeia fissa]
MEKRREQGRGALRGEEERKRREVRVESSVCCVGEVPRAEECVKSGVWSAAGRPGLAWLGCCLVRRGVVGLCFGSASTGRDEEEC